ncbi:MAG: DUF433 domain-containing protein [Nitrospirae bacterium]|nr:DUF433 domain-containing protein [Nitrospirota bacterium]
MPTIQKSVRIPEHILREIEEIAKETRKDFTTVANELIEEALKAHRCPGIAITEGTAGKRAKIAGTGIEVWEIIAAYAQLDRDVKRLRKGYPWLTEQQIQAALGYYQFYPEEIDNLVKTNESWTPEKIRSKYPFLPKGRP